MRLLGIAQARLPHHAINFLGVKNMINITCKTLKQRSPIWQEGLKYAYINIDNINIGVRAVDYEIEMNPTELKIEIELTTRGQTCTLTAQQFTEMVRDYVAKLNKEYNNVNTKTI
jgi:hypothetical protein